jgi:ubiquinone biosynthesis protein
MRRTLKKSEVHTFTSEQLQAAVHGFLREHTTTAARTRAIESALRTGPGQFLRDELGKWVIQILPAEQVVPDIYAAWRPLVRDSMLFMISRLSGPRLAPKIVEQFELPPDTSAEQRLLRLISRVPGLQKIGQVLARNRHLHPSLRKALSELENGISDVNPAEVRAMIVEELGPRLKEYAVEIEPGMFSEASVSAVMRFTWLNPESGERERGVFKALKPYVPACFQEDMTLLQQLSAFLAMKHPEYGRALPETLTNVRHLLEHEVQYRREQAVLAEASRVYGSLSGVRVPGLIRALSTPKITALTEEQGVKVTGAFSREPAWRRKRVAEQLIETLVAAPLFAREDKAIFHADPHAGNLLYDEQTGELIVLDWALTERLTQEQRRHVAILALMIALRDSAGVCAEIESLALGGVRHDAALHEFVRDFVGRFIDEIPLSRPPGSMEAMRLLDRLALEGVRFPSALLMFRKVLFTLDGILHDIGAPNVHMDMVIARHMATRWVRHWWTFGSPLNLMDWVAVQSSALLYFARLWVQWAQSALAEPGSSGTPSLNPTS